eukprot:6144085-Pleurochrysis_carterae.AAC.4
MESGDSVIASAVQLNPDDFRQQPRGSLRVELARGGGRRRAGRAPSSRGSAAARATRVHRKPGAGGEGVAHVCRRWLRARGVVTRAAASSASLEYFTREGASCEEQGPGRESGNEKRGRVIKVETKEGEVGAVTKTEVPLDLVQMAVRGLLEGFRRPEWKVRSNAHLIAKRARAGQNDHGNERALRDGEGGFGVKPAAVGKTNWGACGAKWGPSHQMRRTVRARYKSEVMTGNSICKAPEASHLLERAAISD